MADESEEGTDGAGEGGYDTLIPELFEPKDPKVSQIFGIPVDFILGSKIPELEEREGHDEGLPRRTIRDKYRKP